MRGQRVFNELIKGNGIEHAIRRGRNNALLTKRNECLLARYYYYGYLKNKGYEEILRLLVTEFFLSAATIGNVIQEHVAVLQQLKQKSPTLFYFQNRWPNIKW